MPASIANPALKNFLDFSHVIHKVDGGYLGECHNARLHRGDLPVTVAEAASYDPRLPLLLDLLIQNTRNQPAFGWIGMALRVTMAHWHEPGPRCPELGNDRIFQIARAGTNQGLHKLSLMCTRYNETTDPRGFDYVIESKAAWCTVSFDWADAQWPGIKGRVEAAEAIGCDERQVARLVFSPQPSAQSVDLTDITLI